jgi:hypothetical protein
MGLNVEDGSINAIRKNLQESEQNPEQNPEQKQEQEPNP